MEKRLRHQFVMILDKVIETLFGYNIKLSVCDKKSWFLLNNFHVNVSPIVYDVTLSVCGKKIRILIMLR